MRYVRHLADLGRGDLATAGGKGANLGELVRAGLPVPPGVVLTTAAYWAFVASSGIGDRLLALADVVLDAAPAAYEEPSRRIRALFAAAPVLDDGEAAALARLGTRIEGWFGAPQDVEWARADGTFWIVQARPVTALPVPAAPPPTDWTVPDPTALYARASIVEQLPDPLTPLFAELVDPSVTRSLQGVMSDLLGRDAVRAGDVGLPTVNGYAYYRYSRAGMLRMLRKTPSALRALARRGRASVQVRWRDEAHPRYVRAVERATARPLPDQTDAELLDGVAALLDAGTAYYTAVRTIIPLAASSETVFTAFHRLVRRAGDPPAATFLLGFDSAPIRAERSLYALAAWTRGHPDLADAVAAAPPERTAALLTADGSLPGVEPAVWREFATRWRAHLAAHGHTVYNLDFAAPVPADDPAPLIATLRFYLGGGGTDPIRPGGRRRPRSAARRRRRASAAGSTRCGGRCSPASCGGRRPPPRCAKTPRPTSGWPGRSCAGCCTSWAAARWPPGCCRHRTTCSGCTARRS